MSKAAVDRADSMSRPRDPVRSTCGLAVGDPSGSGVWICVCARKPEAVAHGRHAIRINNTVAIHIFAGIQNAVGNSVGILDIDNVFKTVFAVQLGSWRVWSHSWIKLHATPIRVINDIAILR